jgi:hypothetical protein
MRGAAYQPRSSIRPPHTDACWEHLLRTESERDGTAFGKGLLIYVHGNCQAPFLAELLREAYPAGEIRSRPTFVAPTAEELSWYKDSIVEADWVITQWVSRGYLGTDELSFDWIKEKRAGRRNVIAMPPVYFRAQMPHMFYFNQKWLEAIPLPMSTTYHNVLIPHMVSEGFENAEIIRRLSSVDLYPPTFVATRAEEGLAELRRREEFLRKENDGGATVVISELIEALWADHQIGWSFDHPTRFLMIQIAREVLRLMGIPAEIETDGSEPLNFTRCGILPAVANQLQLPAHATDSDFVHWEQRLDIRSYVERMVPAYRSHSRDELRQALREQPEVSRFIEQFTARGGIG